MENPNSFFPTTIDNPFHPLNEFDDWLAFDRRKGYNTLEKLDKFYKTSDLISDSLDEFLYEDALNKFLDLFPFYIIVDKETVIKPIDLDEVEQNLGLKTGETPVES